MARRSDALVVVIGLFKLLKATALIAVAVTLAVLGPRVVDVAIQWLVRLNVDLTAAPARKLLVHLEHISGARRGLVEAMSLAYAALFLVEGVGLVLRKTWAEWLTVVVTGSFIPWEVWRLARRHDAFHVVLLALNVAIVMYLLWLRLSEGRRLPHAATV